MELTPLLMELDPLPMELISVANNLCCCSSTAPKGLAKLIQVLLHGKMWPHQVHLFRERIRGIQLWASNEVNLACVSVGAL